MKEVNILIMEDDVKAANVLEETLKTLDYKIWSTEDPKQGLELARNTNFAVAITELRSPRMNGIEVAKAMREVSPATSVIVITAYAFISSAVEALEAGAQCYITKPLIPAEIKIMVERSVERFYLAGSQVKKDYYAKLSIRDELTGLYNYRYFKELLNFECSQSMYQSGRFTLLMMDIDNFKSYNDTQGHPAGDELLRNLAKLIKESVREIDAACRYGGEEFVVILPITDKKGSESIAKNLLTLVNLYLPRTLSIGIATYPDDAQDPNGLVAKADKALYQAKRTGKNKYCLA